MKIGDLIRVKDIFTSHGIYEGENYKIGMILEGPNEVGKIRILFSSGDKKWLHSAEVEYIPKGGYLKR